MISAPIPPHWKWLDSISLVNAAETQICAHRKLLSSEWYFAHHFECYPVLPGVFLIEMMSHAAGYLQVLRMCTATGAWAHYFLAGADNARFYREVLPDDEVTLSAVLRQGDDEQVVMAGEATVAGKRVARAELMLHRVHAEWLSEQDAVLVNALRRMLSEPLQHRYKLI